MPKPETPSKDRDSSPMRPEESTILTAAYKRSGLTAADLATATGLSVGAVRIALSGFRHRNGARISVIPTDSPLVRLSSVLGIDPEVLRDIGRERAADLLVEGKNPVPGPDLDTTAAVAARDALVRQMLSLFSTGELRAEIERRTS